jgi:protein disulfide-isomerase
MKKLCFFMVLFFCFAVSLAGYAQANSYLDTIYRAEDKGANSQCPPGEDCPDESEKQCVGDECETEACEGEECKTPECSEENCPDGECVDGKCVPNPQSRIKNMLKRIESILNNLINRILNRLMGIKVGVKVIELPEPAIDDPEPEPTPEPEEEPKEEPAPENVYKEYTNWEAAKKAAADKGHPIMMVFSGSDWCGWCKKFEAEILTQPAFQDYAKDNMETFIADFPRNIQQSAELKQQNAALAREYGISGYPTVMIVNPDGSVIKKTGYIQGGAENYVNHLKSIID